MILAAVISIILLFTVALAVLWRNAKRKSDTLYACSTINQAILDSSPAAIIYFDLNRTVHLWNGGAERIFGWTAGEAVGCELPHMQKCLEVADDLLVRLTAGETIPPFEAHRLRKDGSEVRVIVSIAPVRNASGQIVGAVSSISDATDVLQAKAASQQAEERLNLALSTINEGVWDWSPIDGKLFLSDRWYSMLGYQPGGRTPDYDTWARLVHPDDLPAAEKEIQRIIASPEHGNDLMIKCRMKKASGEWVWVFERGQIVARDEAGRATRVVGVQSDFTELLNTAGMLTSLMESSPAAIMFWDLRHRLRSWNQAAEKIYGWSSVDVLGKEAPYLDDAERDELYKILEGIFTGEKTKVSIEARRRRKDGSTVDIYAEHAPVKAASGDIVGSLSVALDVSDKKILQRELEDQRDQMASIVNTTNDAMLIVDRDGMRIKFANDAAERILGLAPSAILGNTLVEIGLGESAVATIRDLEAHPKTHGEIHLFSVNAGQKILDVSGGPLDFGGEKCLLVVCRDITDLRMHEQAALRAQRFESLGIVAGGIAHDLNNFLQIIFTSVTHARDITSDPALSANLHAAEVAAEQARDLTLQLQAFTRAGVPMKKTMQLAPLIRDTLEMSVRGHAVDVQFDPGEKCLCSDVDSGQIAQVINNLAINAVQALPRGGRIAVSLAPVCVTDAVNPGVTDETKLERGEYVTIRFADDGPGIPPEAIERVFDPYFTTKDGGTGLGLAMCYSIIRRHGGLITVSSEPGAGTVFVLYLPASDADVCPAPVSEQAAAGETSPSGRILLVDDEQYILDSITSVLIYQGHEVASTTSSESAVEMYRYAMQIGRPYDIVLTDVTMPGGKGGEWLILELLKVDHNAKVIVSTGHANSTILAHYREFGFIAALRKPYKAKDLIRTVQGILVHNNSVAPAQ